MNVRDMTENAVTRSTGRREYVHVGTSTQQFPIWRSKRVWGMLGEDVGSRADFCSSAIAPALPYYTPSLA